ncbi:MULTISPECIES: nickel-binding protein [Desulfobacula]|uniref:YCII-related domain-containing protein n=2 Tax=Desulfobacula TaxID=28222 RepID=K0NGC9_DESTT|nr:MULTISPECIES: nickel-binding protein [Desulfobacula]CCK79965.1 uncharacterized protein TOL2_C18040 [Desulfobacula toluolica Tol2]SDU18073.1 Protein of unknown function [Desulfobacula phenolica]
MAKVAVFHYTEKARIPELTPEQAAGFKASMEKNLAENPDVKLEGIFVNSDGIGFGIIDAPDAEAARKVVEGSGAAYDLITEVQELKL